MFRQLFLCENNSKSCAVIVKQIIGEKHLTMIKWLSKLLAEYLLSLINVKQIKTSSLFVSRETILIDRL